MKKKQFDKLSLYALIQKAQCGRPSQGLAEGVTRLRLAMLTHRLWELYGTRFVYGSAMRFDEFLADAPAPWASGVAPLCVFAGGDRHGSWAAAAVFSCGEAGEESDAAAATAENLRAAGVGYLLVPAAWFQHDLLAAPAFSEAVGEVLAVTAPADPESFLSEPRPLYPPRSRVLRD